MRVAHVITRLIIGGAQENTIASVLGLQGKSDVEALLLSGPSTGSEGSMQAHFNVCPHLLQIVPTLVRPIHPWKDVLAWRDLARYFVQARPDIVHTHSGKAGVLGRLAARHANVPVIVHTIHGPSFGSFQGKLPNAMFRAAERTAGRATTHFVSVAQAMTEQYLAAGIGAPAQYTRIFSGFDLDPFLNAHNNPELRSQLGIGANDIVIGKIARLFKLKGHDDLLAAAPEILRQVPNARFLLVGDGPWRERLERKAHSLRLAHRFHFPGLIPPDQVPRYVGIMDILVHLSSREGLPRALPQALAAGKPVVSYNGDGASEVCRDGETGWLIRPGDFSRLTEKIALLANNPALRERYGKTGAEWVRSRFSVERMVDDLYALYQRLLAERPQHGPVRR